MKKKNCKCDYILERNENLKSEFYARLGKDEFPRVDDIFPRLAQTKAKRFYVNEERALQLIRHYEKRGCWPSNMMPTRKRMMSDILRRVESLRAFRPAMSLREAVYDVVNSEAPSFYLTPRSIRTLLYASLAG